MSGACNKLVFHPSPTSILVAVKSDVSMMRLIKSVLAAWGSQMCRSEWLLWMQEVHQNAVFSWDPSVVRDIGEAVRQLCCCSHTTAPRYRSSMAHFQ